MKIKKRNRVIALLLSCAMLLGDVYGNGSIAYATSNENIVEENVTEDSEVVSEEALSEEVVEEGNSTEQTQEVAEVFVTEDPTPTIQSIPTVSTVDEREVKGNDAKGEVAKEEVTEVPKENSKVTEVVSPTNEPTSEPTTEPTKSEDKVTATVSPTTEPTVVEKEEKVSPTVVEEEGVEVVSADSLDEFAENLEDNMFDSKQLIVISSIADFESYGATSIQNFDDIYVLSYETSADTKSAYSKLKKTSGILSVGINEVLSVSTESTEGSTESESTTEKTELGKYLGGLTASKSVRVAVLDTGLNTTNFNGKYEDLGIDYTSEKATSLYDENGHGTDMANLIIENSNSLVSVVPIKVADNSGKASVLNTYLGIKKAIEAGVNVINISMSASASTTSSILTDAINEATEKGILVVVSAGNLGLDTASVSPANVGNAIVVSAVNGDNSFASYSNYGSSVDYSAYGSYNGKTGTSYATARVTGIIADLLSKGSSASILDSYTIDLGNEGADSQFGKGLLALETIKGDSEEDEISQIAKENKAKYENLCANWKGMSDAELNSALEDLSETLRGYFLTGLSVTELEEVLKRDTILVKPLNVVEAIIVNSLSEISSNTEEPEVKTYDKAYKYYMELSEQLETSADNSRKWASDGSGYFKFYFSKSGNESYNGTVQVNISGVGYPNNSYSSTVLGASNVSFSGTQPGFSLGTPYIVRQEASTTDWTGIYLVGMKFGIEKYYTVSKVYSTGTEQTNFSRFGFYKDRGDGSALGDDDSANFVNMKPLTANGTVTTYFQANAYNIGLDRGVGEYHAQMCVEFARGKSKMVYHRNRDMLEKETKDKTTHEVEVNFGSKPKLISNPTSFTKDNYTFKGWYVGSSTTLRQPGFQLTSNVEDLVRNVYAQWEPKVYEITLNNQSATTAGSKAYYEKYNVGNYKESTCGTSISKITVPTKKGYIFKGYFTKKNGGGTQYVNESGTILSKKDTFEDHTTLYASWVKNTRTVNIQYYRRDNASSSWERIGSNVTLSLAEGSSLDFSSYINKGYTEVNASKNTGIASYNYSKACYKVTSSTSYTDISGKSLTIPAEDVVIHLKYVGSAVTPTPSPTPIPAYKFTVNPNGGTIVTPDGVETSSTWSKTYTTGESIFYFCTGFEGWAESGYNACSLPTRDGYVFSHWSMSPSNAVVDQHLFNPWWDFHTTLSTNVTATAQWKTDIVYYYYKYDIENSKWKLFKVEDDGYSSVGSTITGASISGRVTANVPEGYKYSGAKYDSINDGADYDLSDFKLEKSTAICIGYMPKELNLTINVKGGTYKSAAGSSRENFGTTFDYGVEEEFSSKDVNTYVAGGISLPTKTGYHLCDPNNEADVEYATANNFAPEPWSLVNGATGEVLDSDTYSYNGLSTVDVTIEANWVPNVVNLNINPNGGYLYGYDYNTAQKYDWAQNIFTKQYTMGTEFEFADTVYYTSDPNSRLCFASNHYGFGGTCDGTVLDTPYREGYNFVGWTSNNGGTITEKTENCRRYWVYKNESDNMDTITLTAQWEPKRYNLTINADGGTMYQPDGTLVGSYKKEFIYGIWDYFSTGSTSYIADWNVVSKPTKKGNTFKGWSPSNGTVDQCLFETWYDFHGDYAGDVTITAQWELNKSTLNVNPNGGLWNGYTTQQSYVKSYNETMAIPDPTIGNFTATFNANGGTCSTGSQTTNKAFNYWSVTNGAPSGGTFSNKVFSFGEYVNGSTTLTAIWSGSYNVTLPTPSRVGYTFNGWYTSATGGTRVGGAGSTVAISSNTTYYAQWTPITYILTVNPAGGYMYNGDTYTNTAFTTNAVYGRKTYLGNLSSDNNYFSNHSLDLPSKVGHTFLKWTFDHGTGGYLNSDATSGYIYFSNTNAYTTAKEDAYNGDYAGNVTATATYRIHQSTLHVNPNTGTWKGSTNTQSFTQNYNTTLAIPDPTKPNYTATFDATGGTCTSSIRTTVAFNGWDTTAMATAGTLNQSTKVFTFGPIDNGEGTIKATWVGSYSITLPTPTRPGWDFLGWYTAATGGTKVGNAGDKVTLSTDKTYYAQWTPHPTKITLSNTVDLSKVAFAKGNPVAVFKVEGKDVSGKSHTFIKTLKWDTNSSNYQSLSFTILSGTYTVTLLNQNEYSVGTPSGTSNVTVSGVVATSNMSNGSESTVNFTTSENDYSKYTGNSLVTTSLK